MTEEEAKTKWCPKAANTKAITTIAAMLPVVSGNTATKEAVLDVVTTAIKDSELCIASGCMLWTESDEEGAVIDDGYCGLARAKR